MTRNQRTQAEARVASTLDAMTDEARAVALARLERRAAKVRRQFGPVPDSALCDCLNAPAGRDGLCAACRADCVPMERTS